MALSVCVWWYRFGLIIGLIIGVVLFITSFLVRNTTYTQTDATVASDSIYRNEKNYETIIIYNIITATAAPTIIPDGTLPPGNTQTLHLPMRRYKGETISIWYNAQAPDQVSTANPSNAGTILLVVSLLMIVGALIALWLSSKFPELFCALGVLNTVTSSRF